MQMVGPDVKTRFARLQARWRDPLLTTLTILLAIVLFVLAPLHAAGIVKSENFGLALLLICTAALFVVSGNPLTVVAVVVAIGFAVVAAALRLRHSPLDLYFDATAWTILGVSVGWVVARAVFGPGEVTYHRIMGAILLYLIIGATFVALYTFVGLSVPNAFSGVPIDDSPALPSNFIYFSFVTLTSTGYGEIVPVHPFARSLCNIEGIIGQLYPATLLARLVSLAVANRQV
jgi:voltage-gated potassium channel Kch